MSKTSTPGIDADVLAAGVVPWREGDEIAVVHRPRYDDWSLPKGKLNRGETIQEAAVRETAEETGYRVRLGARLGGTRYRVPDGKKVVHYWAGQVREGAFAANDEVDELRWLAPAAAVELLSYDWDRDVLARFRGRGAMIPRVLLVRHARAGSRHTWDGVDELRPLSATGRRQAGALRQLLVAFGPDRVYTAPPLRCVQTVEPLAQALGQSPVVEPLLGEEGYRDDPAAGLRRVLELAAEPLVNVVCSQGGVIPDVVHGLAGWAGIADSVDGPGGYPPSRKASVWALGFRSERLSFADYYPDASGS